MRLKFRDHPIPLRSTPAADDAVERNLVAMFSPGHQARASEGGGLAIHAPEGHKVATFHAGGHHAITGDEGELRVYHGRTGDRCRTPADLNRINAEAYARRLV